MSMGIGRRRRGKLTTAWTILTALLANVVLIAWFYTNPYHYDPWFVHRAEGLMARLGMPEAAKSQIVLMVGSSRTMNGFHARVVESAIADTLKTPFIVHNLGMTGAGPVVYYLTAKRLFDAGVRPHLLLVEISPCLLNGRDSVLSEQQWTDPNRLNDRETEAMAKYGWKTASPTLWQRITPSWFEHREFLTRKLMKKSFQPSPILRIPFDPWGYYALPTPNNAQERCVLQEKAREQFEPLVEDWTSEGPAVEVLRLLLDLCRRERVPVAVVMPPEGPFAQKWYSIDSKARVKEFLERFSASENCPLVDSWNWLDEEDFRDSHHMADGGAKTFSARLAHEFLIPWFDGGSDGRSHAPWTVFFDGGQPVGDDR